MGLSNRKPKPNYGLFKIMTAAALQAIVFFSIRNMDQAFNISQWGIAPDNAMTIEDLMYKYGSDKSRDDHGYSKLYHMLFSSIRLSVSNVTEVGIAAGQSLQAWHQYFPKAEIHAFDVNELHNAVKNNTERLPRVHTYITNILREGVLSKLGFVNESMDVIIEDGPHDVSSQEGFLARLFPILRPGGLYVIEDVGPRRGVTNFHDNPQLLRAETRMILEGNDAIWVDAAFGHRAWEEWVNKVGVMWAMNRTYHNSNCIVIQKREGGLREPMQMNYKNGAMDPESIVVETGE